ncbi:MAG: sensor domain-containing diguanylate cyclase [Marinomonas sp.]
MNREGNLIDKLRFILSIRLLIVSLVVAGIVATLFNGYWTTYQAHKKLIIELSLDSNRVYAEKLARMTRSFVINRKAQLAKGSEIISPILEADDGQFTSYLSALEDLRNLSNSFNSITVIDRKGEILSISPETLELTGTVISPFILKYFKSAKPQFLGPLIGPAGTYLILLSHPLINSDGLYIGDLVGSIYLQDNIFLDRLLSQHGYDNGSYVYVVSSEKELLYHPKKERISEKVTTNDVINRVITGESGAREVVNSVGVSMLAGYAYVEEAGWGVVAQTPKEAVLDELRVQVWSVLKSSIAVQLFIFFLVIICAYLIARPLRLLAESTKDRSVLSKVNAWFYEAYLLRKSFSREMDQLHKKVTEFDEDRKKDPLTGLMNRRALDESVNIMVEESAPFSLIFFDVDNFKYVNDTFGHDVGDESLQMLANEVSACVKGSGIVFRTGGDEFIVVLPGINQKRTMEIADIIQGRVANRILPKIGKPISLSLGLSNWNSSISLEKAFKKADQAMYASKLTGRNRITADFI